MTDGEPKASAAWAEFLLAPAGGAVLGLLVWLLLKEPCYGVDGYECVKVGDTVMPPGWAAMAGTVLGFVIGGAIHLFREK